MVFDLLVSIIGAVLGLYLIVHLRPLNVRLHFSDQIGKYRIESAPSGISYRIKIQNRDVRRLIDVEFRARISIKNLEGNTNLQHFYLTTGTTHIPIFEQRKRGFEIVRKWPFVAGRSGNQFPATIVSIRAPETGKLTSASFPQSIRGKIDGNALFLEDLFELDGGTFLTVYVFGYDSYSGTRRVIRSKRYKVTDIKEGRFRKGGLDIVPEATPATMPTESLTA